MGGESPPNHYGTYPDMCKSSQQVATEAVVGRDELMKAAAQLFRDRVFDDGAD